MKKLFRLVVLLLIAGGWGLASSALYVVRTPSKVIVIPKDHLDFKDTYVDTRQWTLADDAAHPEVVARLVQAGKSDLLAHTVNTNSGPVDVQLTLAIHNPAGPATQPSVTDKVTAKAKQVADAVKARI